MKTLLADFFHLLLPNHTMTTIQMIGLLAFFIALGILLASVGI